MPSALVRTAMALLIGAAGGALFALLGTPLPWTLGAITTSAIAAIAGNRWPMPGAMREAARPVVGVMAGSAFTPAIAAAMLAWWPSLLTVAAYSLAIGAAGFLLFTRLLRRDPVTAYFASMPGGLGELSLLGASLGGRIHTLVLTHAIRVVTIVFGIPVILQVASAPPPPAEAATALPPADTLILIAIGLAGYAIGRHTRFPGGSMVAAMLLSALVHGTGLTDAAPPPWLIAFVQVLIGSVAGSRFAGITWADTRVDLAAAFAWAGAMLAATVLFASLAAPLLGMPFATMLLALAPGGVAEMIIVSYALGADVAFVAFSQALRIFLVLALAPIFFDLVSRRRPPPE